MIEGAIRIDTHGRSTSYGPGGAWFETGPDDVFADIGSGKGRITQGFDADFTIVDLKATHTIENRWIASKCGWTPYDGMKTTGWALATIIRGKTVMRDRALTLASQGEPIKFTETLSPV